MSIDIEDLEHGFDVVISHIDDYLVKSGDGKNHVSPESYKHISAILKEHRTNLKSETDMSYDVKNVDSLPDVEIIPNLVEQTLSLISPSNGSTIASGPQNLQFNNPNNFPIGIWVGSSIDSNNYYNSLALEVTNNLEIPAGRIPDNGNEVHVRLAYNDGVSIKFVYYVLTAHTGNLVSGFPPQGIFVDPPENGLSRTRDYAVLNPYSKLMTEGAPNYLGDGSRNALVRLSQNAIIDSETGAVVGSHVFARSRLAFTQPRILFGFKSGSTTLEKWDALSNVYTALHDFAPQGASAPMSFGVFEGQQSANDKLFVLTNSVDTNNGATEVYAWHADNGFIKRKTISEIEQDLLAIPVRDGGGRIINSYDKIDSAQADLSGQYICVLITIKFNAGAPAGYQGNCVMVYDANFENPRVLGSRPPSEANAPNDNIAPVPPGHGTFIIDKNDIPRWINAHHNGHIVCSLVDQEDIAWVPTGVSGFGHYSGHLVKDRGKYTYSSPAAPGLVELFEFDASDYGSTQLTNDPAAFSYPKLPAGDSPNPKIIAQSGYTGGQNPGPTASVSMDGLRVYVNTSETTSAQFSKPVAQELDITVDQAGSTLVSGTPTFTITDNTSPIVSDWRYDPWFKTSPEGKFYDGGPSIGVSENEVTLTNDVPVDGREITFRIYRFRQSEGVTLNADGEPDNVPFFEFTATAYEIPEHTVTILPSTEGVFNSFLQLAENSPAQLFYRIQGELDYTARLPFETSNNFKDHEQSIPGTEGKVVNAGDVVEMFWKFGPEFEHTTETITRDTGETGDTGSSTGTEQWVGSEGYINMFDLTEPNIEFGAMTVNEMTLRTGNQAWSDNGPSLTSVGEIEGRRSWGIELKATPEENANGTDKHETRHFIGNNLATEVWVRQLVFFENGFDFGGDNVKSAKLLMGIFGGDVIASGGNGVANGSSSRFIYKHVARDDDRAQWGVYVYASDQEKTFGDELLNLDNGNPLIIETGVWHELVMRKKLNSAVDQADGVLEFYVNGRRLVNQTNRLWLTEGTLNIKHLLSSTFMGGTNFPNQNWAPDSDQPVYFSEIGYRIV